MENHLDDYIFSVLFGKDFKKVEVHYYRLPERETRNQVIAILSCERWIEYLKKKNPEALLDIKEVIQLVQYLLNHFMSERYFLRNLNESNRNNLKVKLI